MKTKIILLFTFVIVSVGMSAQSLKGTSMNERIGHGMDSILVMRAYNTFESYYAKGVNEEMALDSAFLYAYEPWQFVFDKAPYIGATLYKHGSYMWQKLASEGKTSKVRNFFFDKLMMTYDKRVENLEAINSLYDEDGDQSRFVTTKGDIICQKAQNFLQFNPDTVVQLAWTAYQDSNPMTYEIPWTESMENLYQMYKSAIGDLGRSTRGYTLAYFIHTYYYRYKAHKSDSTYAEDFINDYIQAQDLISFFLDSAKQFIPSDEELTAEDSIRYQRELSIQKQIVDEYTYPEWYANRYFEDNPEAASPEFLNSFFSAKIEEKKDDASYLSWVVSTLDRLNRNDLDVYDKASEMLSAVMPATGGSSNVDKHKVYFSQAIRYMKEMDFMTAKESMQQCIEACGDDNVLKAKYLYQAGAFCYSKRRYPDAREYANQAISYNKNYGDPYLLQADILFALAPRTGKKRDEVMWVLGIYACAATDKAQLAMRMDPGCRTKAQNNIARRYAPYYFPKSEAFFRGAKEGNRVSANGITTTLRLK